MTLRYNAKEIHAFIFCHYIQQLCSLNAFLVSLTAASRLVLWNLLREYILCLCKKAEMMKVKAIHRGSHTCFHLFTGLKWGLALWLAATTSFCCLGETPLAKDIVNVSVIIIGKNKRLKWETGKWEATAQDGNQNKDASRPHSPPQAPLIFIAAPVARLECKPTNTHWRARKMSNENVSTSHCRRLNVEWTSWICWSSPTPYWIISWGHAG